MTTNGSSSAGYIDLNNSGIKVIYTNVSDDKSAIMEYLLRGGVSDSLLGDNGVFSLYQVQKFCRFQLIISVGMVILRAVTVTCV